MSFPFSLGGGSALGGLATAAIALVQRANAASSDSQADFGLDISTFPDLDPAFGLMSGRRVLSEALARRYTTETGTLVDDTTYGTDIRNYLNESVTNQTLSAAKSDLEKEALKDERVDSASASVSYDPASSTMLSSVALDGAIGPYVLTLAFTVDSVSIIRGL